MCEYRRDRGGDGYLFGLPLPLLHVTCCDPEVAFCGQRMDDEEDTEVREDERTEDCLPCLHEETRRDRARLGCGSPRCPHQPMWRRLRHYLWLLLWPRNRWERVATWVGLVSGLTLILAGIFDW